MNEIFIKVVEWFAMFWIGVGIGLFWDYWIERRMERKKINERRTNNDMPS